MMRLFENVRDLSGEQETIVRRPYGIIEVTNGRLTNIRFRPWPKIITALEVVTWGRRYHDQAEGNRCWLYYNQPRQHRNFLTLKYVVSTRHTTYKTIRAASVVLDEIARLKRSDAIVCQLSNDRLSDRFMRRIGYEPHLPNSPRRHYIRRFYGQYPKSHRALALCRES